MRPVLLVPEWEPTSVCAGRWWCGAPRRNRTDDPILTMNPGSTAVPLRGLRSSANTVKGTGMGSVTEPGQLIDHHELAVLEDLVVQKPAAVGEHDGTKVLSDDHREGSGGRRRVGAQE